MLSNEKPLGFWILSNPVRRIIEQMTSIPGTFKQSKVTRFLPFRFASGHFASQNRVVRRKLEKGECSLVLSAAIRCARAKPKRIPSPNEFVYAPFRREPKKSDFDSLRSLLRVAHFCPKDGWN